MVAGDALPNRKVITSCVYCSNPPNGQEHWLNRSLGTFAGNTYLTGRICTPCNEEFGRTIDLELARTGHTGVTRQVLGIEGRASHERRNAFDYKTSQSEPPVQVFHVDSGNPTPAFMQAVRRNPDGTLTMTQRRVLVVATDDREEQIPFPTGWGEHQLRSAAEARGLLGGRPVSAHVPPPETVAEFVAASRDIIRAVFGPFEMDVYYSRLDSPVGPVEPTLLRFNLSPAYLRAVAKVAFHYFLWACPGIGGDEPEFSGLRAFVHRGVGENTDFIQKSDSLVDRAPTEDGLGKDCHVFATTSIEADLVVHVHFFSQPIGPAFPTFVVRLGRRPYCLSADWRSGHLAAYTTGIVGHHGTLTELSFDRHA